MKQLTHGSLFSGIGGFELGAEYANIKTLWNCEVDEHKRNVLKKHFPTAKQYDDVQTMNHPEYVDIISGGFPCQDISIANVSNKKIWKDGKVSGINGERSGLWRDYKRILGQIRPKYIVFENSTMLLIRGFEQVLCDISEVGYHVQWECLQNAHFGFNHRRDRIYGIAYSSEIGCKSSTKLFRELSEILPKWTSRQNPVSMPFERFNANSDYSSLRMDDGFSKGLDKRRIEDCGNAVNPFIAYYLFECIKLHYKNAIT